MTTPENATATTPENTPGSVGRPGRRAAAALAVAGFALVTGGCTGGATAATPAAPATTSAATGPAATAPSTSITASPSATPSSASTAGQGPQPIPVSHVRVTSVKVASVGITSSSMEKLGLLSDGSLAAPKDPGKAGWFAGGTLPGDVGPAVIAGHIDSLTGPAVFYPLRLTKPGSRIVVGLSNHKTVTFTVDRVITTPKQGFPTNEVFGPVPDSELRLITCGGPYNRSVQGLHGYQDNTIVFATKS